MQDAAHPPSLDEILALETAALERWGKGDPSGFLEISGPEVTYFDPFLEQRINGLPALARYYEGIRGKVAVDAFEFIAPRLEAVGDMAVLSFNLASRSGNDRYRWNCTEVYRRISGAWRIVQSHWSIVKPFEANSGGA